MPRPRPARRTVRLRRPAVPWAAGVWQGVGEKGLTRPVDGLDHRDGHPDGVGALQYLAAAPGREATWLDVAALGWMTHGAGDRGLATLGVEGIKIRRTALVRIEGKSL